MDLAPIHVTPKLHTSQHFRAKAELLAARTRARTAGGRAEFVVDGWLAGFESEFGEAFGWRGWMEKTFGAAPCPRPRLFHASRCWDVTGCGGMRCGGGACASPCAWWPLWLTSHCLLGGATHRLLDGAEQCLSSVGLCVLRGHR